jgi:hypothetical protein
MLPIVSYSNSVDGHLVRIGITMRLITAFIVRLRNRSGIDQAMASRGANLPRFTKESDSSLLSMYSIAFIDVINAYDTWMIHELHHDNFAVDTKALLISLCLPGIEGCARAKRTKSRGRILLPVAVPSDFC